MFDHQTLIAFLLTLFAGLSTGIGSAIAFFSKRTNTTFLCFARLFRRRDDIRIVCGDVSLLISTV